MSQRFIVVSWTNFHLPVEITIEERGTEVQKEFRALMSYTDCEIPGFCRAVYGRVKEDPETVWILAGWENDTSLNVFEATNASVEQRAALSDFGATLLDTHRFNVDGEF
ncbi:hypothetical protein BCR34DRAFT_597123 [Clohesyomyces aquaticus]|uniref:ABM domain-containing protein n=1 Tax=Clohesyomyces aquaticus TaxID=1231657 RepID=A0A1Y2A4U8_9PLEO|nr:hypothetical protein BCR34DRAFT_597123 [Clohesyomyces aquaticus]